MPSLIELFGNHQGRSLHKWVHYFEPYERHFARFVNTPVRVLEIGVCDGGSLQLWKKYFGDRCSVVGIDSDPTCQFDEPQIKVEIGAQSDPVFLEQVQRTHGPFDIIIDDGSHDQSDVLNSFLLLYPGLASGGVYLVEDLHAAYFPGYGGGIDAPSNFVSVASRFTHDVNLAFMLEPYTATLADLKSICFYNSVVVFEKGPGPELFSKEVKGGQSILHYTPESLKAQHRGAAPVAPATALPLLYGALADWYDLVIPLAAVRDECLLYKDLLFEACAVEPRSLLDLGSGAGQTGYHLKDRLALTLVDLAPEMIERSKKLNPECEHQVGDMRTVRLGKQFDLVLLNDSVGYMADLKDLRQAVRTAWEHCRPGGAALFCPDYIRESFIPSVHCDGRDDGDRSLRYLAWVHQLPGDDAHFALDMSYLMQRGREGLRGIHERHLMGLFSRPEWLAVLEEAGFEARRLTVSVGPNQQIVRDAFVGSRPALS